MKTSFIPTSLLFFVLMGSQINAFAQINAPNGKLGTNTTHTNIGIGSVTYPANMLHIQAPALADTAERLFRLTVDDAQNDFFQIVNGTGSNAGFAPMLWGHCESANPNGAMLPGLGFLGSCNVNNDISGNRAVVQFDATSYVQSGRLTGVPGHPEIAIDPLIERPLQNRPLFDWCSAQSVEMRLMPNGTLGIGNPGPDPQSRLDVGGDIIIGSTTPGQNRLIIQSRAQNGGDYFAIAPSFPGNSNTFDLNNGIYIVPGKGVGIGTNNLVGNARFAVAGKMYAEQIVVKLQANWPDTVFSSTYKLQDLNSLEKYVNTNKHLPDVPSEATLKQSGIDLADMQKVQMQKIEELSLYIIQLHKDNEALKAKMELLEKKMERK